MAALALLALSAAPVFAVDCRRESLGSNAFTACAVNLRQEKLRLYWKNSYGKPYHSFSALRLALAARGRKLVFAMNAGMFEPDFSPVGLFIAEGRIRAPLNHKTGVGNFYQMPNGVFLIDRIGARVLSADDYVAQDPKPRLATQSGPLLLHGGEITNSAVMSADSQSRKLRNGVCAPTPTNVVFVISEAPLTFHEFAAYFRDRIGCQEALYLDGSLSSLYSAQLSREDVRRELGPIIAVTRP